ncbi:MAG: TerC family protein [Actinomycetota bacterium]
MVELWVWVAFVAFILAMLALDLFFLHRDAHVVAFREAAIWSAVWVTLGLSFGVVIWVWQGAPAAGEYIAGYLIEKSLSIDNIFIFALVLGYFQVPPAYQHRVLFWGVLGALAMRAVFIAAGAALLDNFHWMIYLFGGFLILTAIRMGLHKGGEVHPERNPMLRLMRRMMPMSRDYDGASFFTLQNGKRMATPMLAVLIVIETTDLVFAIDSIPAIFAITRDTFLVFTSNAFAILGLRAMYFMLAGMMDRFVYLKAGLAVVLGFVGLKMVGSEVVHVPIWISLTVIATVLGVSVIASLRKIKAEPPATLEV